MDWIVDIHKHYDFFSTKQSRYNQLVFIILPLHIIHILLEKSSPNAFRVRVAFRPHTTATPNGKTREIENDQVSVL